MGYYCTVPQCTSLAGKTKNVKFHRFPRDETLAHRWNEILHRNKPFTKYSKVCSLHFTQADYNITTMGKKTGQWKTLSKDAVPTMNLPKLNADGTVMVIRKSRSLKYKPNKSADEAGADKREWSTSSYSSSPGSASLNTTFNTSDAVQQHLSSLNALAANVSPQLRSILQRTPRAMKHDATMQTEPLDVSQRSEQTEQSERPSVVTAEQFSQHKQPVYRQTYDKQPKNYSKDEFKNDDYSKEAEAYALERGKRPSYEEKSPCFNPPDALNSFKQAEFKEQETYKQSNYKDQETCQNDFKEHEVFKQNRYKEEEDFKQNNYKEQEAFKQNSYKEQEAFKQNIYKEQEAFKQSGYKDEDYKPTDYKDLEYSKIPNHETYKTGTFDRSPTDIYEDREGFEESYAKPQEYFPNAVDVLRNQQQNLQVLQQQLQDERVEDARFYSGRIKEEMDLNADEEKFVSFDNTQKENEYTSQLLQQQRLMDMYEARPPIKSEPDVARGCETVMQAQASPLPGYYRSDQHEVPVSTVSPAFYGHQREDHVQQQYSQQPGAELLIAKQNALAATLWQNSMKRPFYYSDAPHAQFGSGMLQSRYEDLNRLMNQ